MGNSLMVVIDVKSKRVMSAHQQQSYAFATAQRMNRLYPGKQFRAVPAR